MAGRNNKKQVDNGRAPNELILGRKEKEDNILDTDYMEHKKGNMLTTKELEEKMRDRRQKKNKRLNKRLRNKRESLEEGDKILVKTLVNTGRPKYDTEATITYKDERGNIYFEIDKTEAESWRHEDHVRKDTRTKEGLGKTPTSTPRIYYNSKPTLCDGLLPDFSMHTPPPHH